MRRRSIYILFVFSIGILLCNTVQLSAQDVRRDSTRWDLEMIEEARIWKKLLVNYAYAEHEKYWPETRAALREVVEKHAASQWADDAALMLAGGKASFEGDVPGAIADLVKVVEEYPDGQTVVARWDPEDGCRLDEVWLMWQGSLVFLNPDGSMRVAKPFDKDRDLSQLEREALTYFDHLKYYPVSTQAMARLFMADMHASAGDQARASAVLREMVSDSRAYLNLIHKADRIAGRKPEGYHVRSLGRRPEYRAHLSLIRLYERQGEVDNAVGTARALMDLTGKEGWLWNLNRRIGEFYERRGLKEQAKEQYRLAVDGLNLLKRDTDKRRALVGGSEIPEDFWERTRTELEAKIR